MKTLLRLSAFLSISFAITAHAEPQFSGIMWSAELAVPHNNISVHGDDHLYNVMVTSEEAYSEVPNLSDLAYYSLEVNIKKPTEADSPVGPSLDAKRDTKLVTFEWDSRIAPQGLPIGTFVSKYKGPWLDESANEITPGISIRAYAFSYRYDSDPWVCESYETTIDTVTIRRIGVGGKNDLYPTSRELNELELLFSKKCQHPQGFIRPIGSGSFKLLPDSSDLLRQNQDLRTRNEVLKIQLKDTKAILNSFVNLTARTANATMIALQGSLRVCATGRQQLCIPEIQRALSILKTGLPAPEPTK